VYNTDADTHVHACSGIICCQLLRKQLYHLIFLKKSGVNLERLPQYGLWSATREPEVGITSHAGQTVRSLAPFFGHREGIGLFNAYLVIMAWP
jgi:hypothetical protein